MVHDLLQFWAPSVKLPEIYAALANRGGGLKGRLSRLKSTIYTGMALAAKTRLRKKIIEEGWSKGIGLRSPLPLKKGGVTGWPGIQS